MSQKGVVVGFSEEVIVDLIVKTQRRTPIVRLDNGNRK